MRTFLYSILLLLFSVSGSCQVNNDSSFDTVRFINQTIKDNRSHIYLYQDIHPNTISEIQKHITRGKFVRRIEDEKGNNVSDSIILTQSEVEELQQRLNAFKRFHWTAQTSGLLNLNRLQLISSDTAQRHLEGTIKYQILPPLLFRNGEYCLFYYDYNCGPLCGQGELVIYKKEKQEWKRWWRLFGWNS